MGLVRSMFHEGPCQFLSIDSSFAGKAGLSWVFAKMDRGKYVTGDGFEQ